MKSIAIGIIGFGTVGSGVVEGINRNREYIRMTTDIDISIKTIADLDITTSRGVSTESITLTTNYQDILNDADISLVVQLVGGTTIARDIMIEAIKAGKKIVTANKALLAHHGPELFALAQKHNTTIAFEASVAGGIPVLSALREGLAANTIQSIYGIVNGTCNYILSQMTEHTTAYETTLQDAMDKGYAEADPTFDVEGFDSAHKLVILTALGFQTIVSLDDIYIEGISHIEVKDINHAHELGYAVKSLAIAIKKEQGLELRIHPTLIPHSHPLASVNDVFNAVYIDGDMVGQTMFYGKGAGSHPTASAVIADIIETASERYSLQFPNLAYNRKQKQSTKLIPFEQTVSRFYVRFTVHDEPGVLATIASILSNHSISVDSLIQKETTKKELVDIELMTASCTEHDFQQALKETSNLDFIRNTPSFIRAIDLE